MRTLGLEPGSPSGKKKTGQRVSVNSLTRHCPRMTLRFAGGQLLS